MGIVKTNDVADLLEVATPFQIGVLDTLDEYDYEVLDLRYIDEHKQIVATLKGIVFFITPKDVSISFEISYTPEKVANLCLILAEKIDPKYIHVTDSFIITKGSEGHNIAIFGPDAVTVYENEIAKKRTSDPKHLAVLMNPNVKFYKC